jgi:hypothetical protein
MNTETICIPCLAVPVFRPLALCLQHGPKPESRRKFVHEDGLTPEQRRDRSIQMRKDRNKRCYERNRERRKAQMRARYWRNRERAQIQWQSYWSQNKDAINAKRRAKRAAKG